MTIKLTWDPKSYEEAEQLIEDRRMAPYITQNIQRHGPLPCPPDPKKPDQDLIVTLKYGWLVIEPKT